MFDDVFVPWERVFLAGEHAFAGPLALAFVEHHRFTAVSYKLPLVDALVGSALLMADLNGIAKAGHVREKLVQLISYAETLRGLTHYAAIRSSARELGMVVPDPLYVNMAKYHFAHGYHEAVRNVQDIAGGALVTGPGAEDLRAPETAPLLRALLCRAHRDQRQGSAQGPEPGEGSRRVGVRRLPGGAGGPRRRIARSRETDAVSKLRRQTRARLRPWPGRIAMTGTRLWVPLQRLSS